MSNQPQLLKEPCATCVFHPGNLMHLRPGRLKNLVEVNRKAGALLTCHETTHGQREAGEASCRNFYDRFGDQTRSVQILRALGCDFEEVDL